MQTDADRVVAAILHADDLFLIEVGRLTLLFSRIEDCPANDYRHLAMLSGDEKLKEEAAGPALLHLRILEKRDFLKRVYADIAGYHGVDHGRLASVLGELGNINRLRRTIVHGWIRWSDAAQQPVFIDGRGQSVPAWPNDVLDINMKVLAWLQNYYQEQRAVMCAVMDAYKQFTEQLSARPNLPSAIRDLISKLGGGVRKLKES